MPMDDNNDATRDSSLRKKMEQLVLERTHLSGVSGHTEKDKAKNTFTPYDEDDDDTWVTSAEVRLQQLQKERNQHSLPQNNFRGTGFQPKESLSHDLTFSARPPKYKDSVSAGLSCSLCYVTTLDTNLMDQHLMGQFHTANAEKEAEKWRRENGFEEEVSSRYETVNVVGKEWKELGTRNGTVNVLEKEFREASFNNEGEKQLKEMVSPNKEIVNVGGNELRRDSFHKETIDEMEKSSQHVKLKKHGSKEKIVNDGIGASVTDDTKTIANLKVPEIELNNNLKDKEDVSQTEEIPVGKKEDVQYKSVTETTKEKDTENNSVHEDVKASNTNETNSNNSDCDVCKIFEGGDGEIQRHQIPSHACIGEDLGVLALPAGWTEKVSRTSGGTYYVNNLTKEPQWIRPVEPVIFPEGTVEEQLPEGWVEKMSKSKGCPFYLNKITNQRQWDRPTKAAQMSVAVDSSLAASATKKEKKTITKI